MASKAKASKALLLSLILLFFFFFGNVLSWIPSSAAQELTCSDNFFELDVCVDVLKALSKRSTPSKNYCCSLVANLVQLEASGACLCRALEVHILDVIKRENPEASLSLLFEYCESEIPPDFRCINLTSYNSM